MITGKARQAYMFAKWSDAERCFVLRDPSPALTESLTTRPGATHALALLPLVSLLWDELRRAWFADDAATTGELLAIRRW